MNRESEETQMMLDRVFDYYQDLAKILGAEGKRSVVDQRCFALAKTTLEESWLWMAQAIAPRAFNKRPLDELTEQKGDGNGN